MNDQMRTPPNDEHAEQSVLGAAIQSRRAADEVMSYLQPADFYRPAHVLVWNAFHALAESGAPIDIETVYDRLVKDGEIQRAGGPAYLHTLVSVTPTAANALFYAKIVREHAVNRSLIDTGSKIVQLGYSGSAASENLSAAQAEVLALDAPTRESGQMIGDIVEAFMESVEEGSEGIQTTPWPYGREMPPLAAGRLTVVAGRPGMGKSVCAMDAARHVAIKLKQTVAFFSLEMSRPEVGARTAAAEANIELPHLKPGQMTARDWEKWAARMGAVMDAKLWVDDYAMADPAYIRSECRRLMREHGDLGLVVVDYLQLMESRQRSESRQQEVSGFSRSLKLLAKDLGVPVIAVSQLNRGPEQRQDKKPMMSDLRESGSVEQDADQIILVFREDAYEPETPRAGEVDLIIAKDRFGPQKTVTLAAQLSRARFVPMAEEDPYERYAARGAA